MRLMTTLYTSGTLQICRILYVGLGIDGDADTQYDVLENVIKRRLNRIEGVGEADTWGADPKRIFVDFHRDELMSSRLALWPIVQQLRQDNLIAAVRKDRRRSNGSLLALNRSIRLC